MPNTPDHQSLTRFLPSTGGVALWFYALAFAILPAFLAYKGWVYVLGTVLFAVGMRPHVEAAIEGRKVWFGYRSKRRAFGTHLHFQMSEGWAVKLTGWGLILLTLLGVPLVAFIIQNQGQTFIEQFEQRLPVILEEGRALLAVAHDKLPSIFPKVNESGEGGWGGLSGLLGDTFGEVAKDFKETAKGYAKDGIKLVGILLADWVKLVISAIIIGTLIGNWKKEVAMHRDVITRGISDPGLRANVLRYGELFQEGISLFMIGYLEVAITLSFIYVLAMTVLPLGLGFGTILFMAVVLGFVTAIPKIGGLLSMFLAFFLMFTNIQPGLGWFGYEVISFGWGWDVVVRTVVMMVIAKLMGFLEAYNFTPEIIGARLGMTKVQIIAAVLVWAVGAGFFGMIWGILISLAFQAALRLSQERDAQALAEATSEAAE